MNEISVSRVPVQGAGQVLRVHSPYHPDFPRKARELGGVYSGADKSWRFDVRDEERVRMLLTSIYGTDGAAEVPLVTLRVAVNEMPVIPGGELWLCGRRVLSRQGRDEPVRLGEKTVLIAGGFPAHGGSARYPALDPKPGTVIEVRDLPEEIARKAVGNYPAAVSLAE